MTPWNKVCSKNKDYSPVFRWSLVCGKANRLKILMWTHTHSWEQVCNFLSPSERGLSYKETICSFWVPYGVDLFSEGTRREIKQTGSHKNLLAEMAKLYQVSPISLSNTFQYRGSGKMEFYCPANKHKKQNKTKQKSRRHFKDWINRNINSLSRFKMVFFYHFTPKCQNLPTFFSSSENLYPRLP